MTTAPSVFSQGAALAGNTSGNLAVTLPSHAANDILILHYVCYDADQVSAHSIASAPSGWTAFPVFTQHSLNAPSPGETGHGLFWKRATSGAESNPTITRPGDWLGGADGLFYARAYAIRGCSTGMDPPVSFGQANGMTAANGIFGDMAQSDLAGVSYVNRQGASNRTQWLESRLVVAFAFRNDNDSFPAAPTGFTAGTAVTSSTGTDGGMQVYWMAYTGQSYSLTTASAALAAGYGFELLEFAPVTTRKAGGVPGHLRDLTYR